MKHKDVEKIAKALVSERATHLLMVRVGKGISLSSIATGEDIFDFMQVLIDENPVMLDILKDVVESRMRHRSGKVDITLN